MEEGPRNFVDNKRRSGQVENITRKMSLRRNGLEKKAFGRTLDVKDFNGRIQNA